MPKTQLVLSDGVLFRHRFPAWLLGVACVAAWPASLLASSEGECYDAFTASCEQRDHEGPWKWVEYFLEMEEKAVQLLENPVAPEHEWRHFEHLLGAYPRPMEMLLTATYPELSWEASADALLAESVALAEKRSVWMERWRAANPDHGSAWSSWAASLLSEDEPSAVALLEQELAKNPDNEDLLLPLMMRHFHNDDVSGLERLLELVESGADAEAPQELLLDFYSFADFDQTAILRWLDGRYRQDAENPALEIEYLSLRSRLGPETVKGFEKLEDEVYQKRLVEIAARDIEISLIAKACGLLEKGGDAWESCQRHLTRRVSTAGLALRTEDPAKQAEQRTHWFVDVRKDLVAGALAAEDFERLEDLLLRGPRYAYGTLWLSALHEARSEDAPPHGFNRLCEILDRGYRQGALEAPVLAEPAVCPKRLERMEHAFELCGHGEARDRLVRAATSALDDVELSRIFTSPAPLRSRLSALDRRLDAAAAAGRFEDELERDLTDLLLEEGRKDLLVNQSERRFLKPGRFGSEFRRFLRRIRPTQPELEIEIFQRFAQLQTLPEDPGLRLRFAFELLFPSRGEPDLDLASDHARFVVESPRTSVRELAEAHYLLGRIALVKSQHELGAEYLKSYFETRLEHMGCPISAEPCDRYCTRERPGQRRTCQVKDGKYVWSSLLGASAQQRRDQEKALLLADDYP